MLGFTFLLFLFAFVSIGAAAEVALHWGIPSSDGEMSLLYICNNTDASLILLDGYDAFKPQISFRHHCEYKGNGRGFSNDIRNCPQIAKGISDCQRKGKKVLLSLGFYLGFSSRNAAIEHSNHLWRVFGPKQPETRKSRPFGNAAVDGIHVDWPTETSRAEYYLDFIKHFRQMQPNVTLSVLSFNSDLEKLPVFANEARADYAMIKVDFGSSSLPTVFDAQKWSTIAGTKFPGAKWLAVLEGDPENAGYVDPKFIQERFLVPQVGENFGGIAIIHGKKNAYFAQQVSNVMLIADRQKSSSSVDGVPTRSGAAKYEYAVSESTMSPEVGLSLMRK